MMEQREKILSEEPVIPDRDRRPLSCKSVNLLLFGLLFVCMALSFLVGRYPVPMREFFGIVWGRLIGFFGQAVTPFWTAQMESAVINVRLPRVLMGVLVGACLAAAGASYQGVFQNPMASPDLLGASAGAGFGAALAIYYGLPSFGITLSAFCMSLATVAVVFFISKRTRGERVLGLILAGIMVSSLFSAGTSFIKLVADPTNKLPLITYWLMGSLAGAKWSELRFVIFPMLAGLIPLFLLRWRLSVLTMGDDEARSMGVDAGRLRFFAVLCATLVTASAVSVSGMIGWVGLVIPHMMRKLVGSDYRWLMPASMTGGGLFLLIVDNVSRNLFKAGLPIGILTAFVGAPFFLWLITRRG
ncbi:MAG TPA: iron ABC transporter permease [Candidatus Acidoferrum sp.]|nr:iron ABC transporter permease [Candidatus Acidoferrum sp.]